MFNSGKIAVANVLGPILVGAAFVSNDARANEPRLSLDSGVDSCDTHKWDFSLSAGMGTREIYHLDESIEKYLVDRGFDEIANIAETLNIYSYNLPYFTLGASINNNQFHPLFARDKLDFLFDLDYVPGFFVKDSFQSVYDVSFQNFELGQATADWTYQIKHYGSVGLGSMYSPLKIDKGIFHLRPAFGLVAGVSYTHLNANLQSDLSELPLVKAIGEDVLEDYLGLGTMLETNINAKGFGRFIEPKFQLSFDIWKFNVGGSIGYRFEKLPLHIDEVTTIGELRMEYEADSMLNLNGQTMAGFVSYTF